MKKNSLDNRKNLNKKEFYADRKYTILIAVYFLLSFYEGYINKLLGESILKYYIVFLIFLLLYSYKYLVIRDYHIILISWFVFLFSSILWSSSGLSEVVKTHMFAYVGMIGLFLTFTFVNFSEKFVGKIINVNMWSSFSIALLGLVYSEAFVGNEQRQVLKLFGYQVDPNNLAAFYLSGFAISLYLLVFSERKKIIYIVILLINFYVILLTGSRGGLVASGVIVFLVITLLIFSFEKGRNKTKKISFFILVTIAGFFIISKYLPEIILERLFDFSSYEGGSNRENLWSQTLQRFIESPLFGNGWGSSKFVVHNTYLNMLTDIGIIGTLLFITFLIILIIKSLNRRTFLAIIIIMTGLIPSLFIDAINKRFLWNAIFLAGLIINSKKEVEEKFEDVQVKK